MSSGLISARVFTSLAKIPVQNAGVGITRQENGQEVLVSYDITDENGRTATAAVEALPDGLLPGNGASFTLCAMKAAHPDYSPVVAEGVRVAVNGITVQDFLLVPSKINSIPAFETQCININ